MTEALPAIHSGSSPKQAAARSLLRQPGLVGAALGSVLLMMSWAAGAEDPRAWIERMGYALDYLNYEGTLVQLHGSEAAVMRVVHRMENGIATERITAMDEVGREIIRGDKETTCILPDQRSVLVERRRDRADLGSPLRQQFGGDRQFTEGLYRLSLKNGGRLVGRDTRLVNVRPTDDYRYGYRLWLDLATAMPLKVQIMDGHGGVVEQILFSQIDLPAEIPASSVAPSLTIDAFTWRRPEAQPAASVQPVETKPPTWHAETLPPGFELRAVRIKPAEAGSDAAPARPGLQQLVFSDGVASVSVFIEDDVDVAEQAEGLSRMGAANVFSTMTADRLVTAVGEVPGHTVETIARAMRPSVPARTSVRRP